MIEDKVIKKLLEHDERLQFIQENMVTKIEHQKIMNTLEGIATIVQRLDQERIFTIQWVRRIETKVETHDKELENQKKEIHEIKLQLKIT